MLSTRVILLLLLFLLASCGGGGRADSGSATGTGGGIEGGAASPATTSNAGSSAPTTTTAVEVVPLGVSLVAGRLGGATGNTDGVGQAARFYGASGIAMDRGGNLYVADLYNATVRKITPAGVVTTLAGAGQAQGTTDGSGSNARFNYPSAVTLHSDGFLYVADSERIRRVSLDGSVTTLNVPGLPVPAITPLFITSIASGKDGLLYVSAGFAIYRFTPGGAATLVAGSVDASGSQDGIGANARFAKILGLAIDAQSVVYVGDGYNNVVRRISAAGEVTTLAGTRGAFGFADGTGAAASFRYPVWPALDPSGNVWVSDGIVLRRITPAGVVTTPYGDQPANPVGGALVFDTAGNLYANNGVGIARIDTAGVPHDLAGETVIRSDTPQPAFGALAVDAQGAVYSLTTATKYLPSGATQALPEALHANLGFFSTRWVALAPDGNFIVSSAVFSSRGINQVTSFGGSISRVTPAGAATVLASWSGASAYTPGNLVADNAGAIYFLDYHQGNAYYQEFPVRKLAPDGTVTSLAEGNALYGTDFYNIDLRQPSLALSPSGTVHTIYPNRIVKVDAQGKQALLAGATGTGDVVDGVGGDARFYRAGPAAFDAAGNLYVGDGNTVRKVTPVGVVTTIAGQVKSRGNTTGPLPASFVGIAGLAVTPDGVLYVASDRALLRIRQQ